MHQYLNVHANRFVRESFELSDCLARIATGTTPTLQGQQGRQQYIGRHRLCWRRPGLLSGHYKLQICQRTKVSQASQRTGRGRSRRGP